MSFWNATTVEPYRQFRFLVEFSIKHVGRADGAPALSFFAMKVDKPTFKVGEYNHKFLNHQFNFPGRLVWDPLTITMVDIGAGKDDNSASGLVQTELFKKYVKSSGYPDGEPNSAGVQAGLDGISKKSATESLGTITIRQLKPLAAGARAAAEADGQRNFRTHEPGQSWTLTNCYLQDVKFGSLDFGSEDAVQITMTVRFDHATASE